jgi:hypothetical protein
MKPWLSAEASNVAAKLRAGQALRLQVIDRPQNRCQLRLGFSPTDLVAPPAVEALLRRGIAVLGADGTIRHGETQ